MSALFDKGRQAFLEGGIAWLTDTIRVCLVDHAIHNPDTAVDDFFNDIASASYGDAGGQTRADMPALATKTSTLGVADADDITISAVPAGAALGSLVLFKDSGADGTSALIAKITGTGLPITPNGGDITISWSAGSTKIFKL